MSQPTIAGNSLIPLPYMPDWANTVEMSYIFKTAQFVSTYKAEQRKALYTLPRREQTFSYTLSQVEAQQLLYDLSYGKDKIFGVPIYNEIIVPTAFSTILILHSSTASLWNLRNETLRARADYLFLLEPSSDTFETVSIYGTGDTVTTFTIAPSETFTVGKTYAFPIFYGFLLRAPMLKMITDQLYTVDLTFGEYIDG